MHDIYCVFCWLRGEVLPEGHRVQTPALLIINGNSVCDREAHTEAAVMGISLGMEFLARRFPASQPGPPDDQNHTGSELRAPGMARRVRGPDEVSSEIPVDAPAHAAPAIPEDQDYEYQFVDDGWIHPDDESSEQ